MESYQFVIESTITIKEHPFVFARAENDGNWALDEYSTLDGAAIVDAQVPRALDEDGNQRMDLFVFELQRARDLSRFHQGQTVALEAARAT